MEFFCENWYMEALHMELYLEDKNKPQSHIIRDQIYPKVEEVLKTPSGSERFFQLVGEHIRNNQVALSMRGPSRQIPLTDPEKDAFFRLFHTTSNEIKEIVVTLLKTINEKIEFKLLKDNPIFQIFYCCIRYYTINPTVYNAKKRLRTCLLMYALAVYPSVFFKYFKQGGANDQLMEYVVDQATEKYTIKRSGNVQGMLETSIESAYDFLNETMKDMNDSDVIRWIQRIRNDQNSLLKKISNIYMPEYRKGTSIALQKNEIMNAEGNLENDFSAINNTSIVDDTVQRIVNNILITGIDISYINSAATLSQISKEELRLCISRICVSSQVANITALISAILYEWIFVSKNGVREINTSKFLGWSIQLFRRTNSKDPNVMTIKQVLDDWAKEQGIFTKYNRIATQINYKKAMFLYIIFNIQKFNQSTMY